jgi:hypothetical protein
MPDLRPKVDLWRTKNHFDYHPKIRLRGKMGLNMGCGAPLKWVTKQNMVFATQFCVLV